MNRSESQHLLRDQFLRAMLEATYPLQKHGPDVETTLEALIEAAELLRVRLELELTELRCEEAE